MYQGDLKAIKKPWDSQPLNKYFDVKLNGDPPVAEAPAKERKGHRRTKNGSRRRRPQKEIKEDSEDTGSGTSNSEEQVDIAHRAIMKEGVGQVLEAYFSPNERKSILDDLRKRESESDQSSSSGSRSQSDHKESVILEEQNDGNSSQQSNSNKDARFYEQLVGQKAEPKPRVQLYKKPRAQQREEVRKVKSRIASQASS